MKTKTLLLAALVGLGASGVLHAADEEPSNVQITFDQPEKYSDIRESYDSTRAGEQANLDAIEHYVQQWAKEYLPADQTLEITFTNIDLAGDFEPWGSAEAADIRIVKSIYPPRIDLSFRVTDSAGAVVKEGEQQLRDLWFLSNSRLNNDDPLIYEKALLGDWMRKDLRPPKS